MQGAQQIFAAITTVNNRATEVSSSIPGQVFDCVTKNITNVLGCVQEIAGKKTATKLLFLLSSQVEDFSRLVAGGIKLPDRQTKCATDQILNSTAQVGGIISNVGRCIKKSRRILKHGEGTSIRRQFVNCQYILTNPRHPTAAAIG
jgi:hypothetical protein